MEVLKKWIAGVCAAALMACLLSACGAPTEPDSQNAVPVEQTDTETEGSAPVEQTDAETEEATPTAEADAETEAPLPEDADGNEDASAQTGAANLDELLQILGDEHLFTERQVDCMGQEFLMACLDVCDPENAVSLFEERDSAAIAALLNERFFQAVDVKPVRYTVTSHMAFALTDDNRAETQAFFQQNQSQVVAQYGETFFQRVSEENMGREQLILLQYTTLDEDGNSADGPDDMTSGLMIMVVNGRYYWNDYSLFQSLSEEP